MSLAPKLDWQPRASIQQLQKRAALLKIVRDFFEERQIIEVDTPLLCEAGTTDVYLESMTVTLNGRTRYLQTSPEYAMKRLLAAGIGDCYQLCKAFRCDEVGRHHNPEFTILEWYRLGLDHHQLMNDMDALLQRVLHCKEAERISYRDLFLQHLNIDPHHTSIEELHDLAPDLCQVLDKNVDSQDDYLMLLLSHFIEPKLGMDRPCFIYDYPASQAALSKVREGLYAERFEVYVHGIELANGFHELQSAEEQKKRFESDNKKRERLNKPQIPYDHRLIAALSHGLPKCSGVALGVDRLIMLALEEDHLQAIMSFDADNC